MEYNQNETHKIINENGNWVLKGTLNECENFKADALQSRHMSKTRVKRWKIVTNLEEKKVD